MCWIPAGISGSRSFDKLHTGPSNPATQWYFALKLVTTFLCVPSLALLFFLTIKLTLFVLKEVLAVYSVRHNHASPPSEITVLTLRPKASLGLRFSNREVLRQWKHTLRHWRFIAGLENRWGFTDRGYVSALGLGVDRHQAAELLLTLWTLARRHLRTGWEAGRRRVVQSDR